MEIFKNGFLFVCFSGDQNNQSSSSSLQVASAIKDIESVVASSRAVVSEHASIFATSSPAVVAATPASASVAQTATVQPIQQLHQQAVTPLSSASPASTASSSAAVAAANTLHLQSKSFLNILLKKDKLRHYIAHIFLLFISCLS